MTIPSDSQIIEPMLEYLARAEKPRKRAKIVEDLAKDFSLTKEEMDEKLDSGGNRFISRVATAIRTMKNLGLVIPRGHGYLEITDKGRKRIGYVPQPAENISHDTPPSVEENQRYSEDITPQGDKFFQEILRMYLSKNEVKPEELPKVIETLRKSFGIQQPVGFFQSDTASPAPTISQEPAVPIEESRTEDHIVCLECGKKFVSLKRHLGTHHKMKPDEYRKKWGLPTNYSMVVDKVSENARKRLETSGWGRRDKFIESIESEVQNPDKSTAK